MTQATLMTRAAGSASFTLTHDAWGRLVLVDAEGVEHAGVEPVRVFPISEPDGWISIADADGRELASIKDPAELSDDVRQLLDLELARRDFVPVIEQIESVAMDRQPSEWKVKTDRGPTTFLLNSEEDVRRLGAHGGMIVDLQGIRYLIRDTRELDAESRRLLERYL